MGAAKVPHRQLKGRAIPSLISVVKIPHRQLKERAGPSFKFCGKVAEL
jgi:hypothetical protein